MIGHNNDYPLGNNSQQENIAEADESFNHFFFLAKTTPRKTQRGKETKHEI
jgi:hypothetical protein